MKLKFKMENAYGIGKLENALEKSALIYATNGTGKTSFYNVFKHFKEEGNFGGVKDRISGNKAGINITLNGKSIVQDNIKLFSPSEMIDKINNTDYFYIPMNEQIKKNTLILEGVIKKLEEENIDFKILKEKKSIESIIKIKEELEEENIDFKILKENKITYKKLNESGIYSEEVQKKIKKVIELKNIQGKIIRGELTYTLIDKSKNFLKALFGEGMSINIGDETISKYEDFEKILELDRKEIEKKIGGDLKEIEKTLDNNKNNRDIRKILVENPDNIKIFSEENKRNIYLNDIKDEVFDFELSDFEDAYKVIKDAEELYNKETFKNTSEAFNQRFSGHLEIDIEEVDDDWGLKKLNFIIKIREKTIESENIKKILSTGEKNALCIFLLMHEILKTNGDKVILIDDEYEVFDFAFKSIFIEYINEIIKFNENNMVLLFTHNYEMFKSFKSRLGNDDITYMKGVVKKNKQNQKILTFHRNPTTTNILKKQKINKNNFCLNIVCLRNVFELTKGTESDEYKFMTDLLHIKKETKNICVEKILNIFKDNDFKIDENLEKAKSKKYLEFLKDLIDEFDEKFEEQSKFLINEKVTLSIGLRLFFEDRYIHRLKDSPNSNQTRAIYEILSPEEKIANSFIMNATPDFIHLNDFNFSPLYDIKINEFIDFYMKNYKKLEGKDFN